MLLLDVKGGREKVREGRKEMFYLFPKKAYVSMRSRQLLGTSSSGNNWSPKPSQTSEPARNPKKL